MRRILQCEFDSRFFQLFGEFFIKSFYEHNKGWELYVVDLGLAQAEREQLQRYGTVKKYPVDPCSRWTNLTGRILALGELTRDDNLIIRFDTDSVILNTYEPLIASILDEQIEIAAPELPHSMADRARNLNRVAALLDVPTTHPCLHTNALTACFTIIRGTPTIRRCFSWLAQNYEQLMYAGKEEEPVISSVMYKHDVRYKVLPWEYFWSVGMSPSQYTHMVPSLRPVTTKGYRVFGVHFAFSKYYMLNSAAIDGHDGWCGWQEIFHKHFDDMPWPDPEFVCWPHGGA